MRYVKVGADSWQKRDGGNRVVDVLTHEQYEAEQAGDGVDLRPVPVPDAVPEGDEL